MFRVVNAKLLLAIGLALGFDGQLAQAGSPTGVGANLHRSYMIKHAQRQAAQGRPSTPHAGIWLAGGYRYTVFGPGNPYLRSSAGRMSVPPARVSGRWHRASRRGR